MHKFNFALPLSAIRELFKSLIIISIVIIAFGQLAKFPTPRPDLNILVIDVVIVCTSILYLFLKFISINQIQSPSWIFFSRDIFIFVTATAWIIHPQWFTGTGSIPSLLYLLRLWMYLLVPDVIIFSLNKVSAVYEVIKTLLFVFVIIIVSGLIQYNLIPDFHFLQFWGWDNHLYRLASTFLDPGFAGIMLILGIILLIPLFIHKLTRPLIYLFIITITGIISLALTFSRASYIAFFIALSSWYLFTRKIIPVIGLTVALLIMIQLAPKPEGEGVNLTRTSTINFRLTNWNNSLNVFNHNRLWGIGYNRYRYVQYELGILDKDWQTSHSASGVDNSALFLLVTTGVVGTASFLIFVAFIVISINLINKRMIKRPESSAMALVHNHIPYITFASLVATFIHGMFHNTWFYPFTLYWIMVLLGLTITVGKSNSK